MQTEQTVVSALLISRTTALKESATSDVLEQNYATVVESIRTLIAPILADRDALTKFPLNSARQDVYLDDEARVITIYLDDLSDKSNGRTADRGSFFEYPPGFKKVRRRLNRLLHVGESWAIELLIDRSYFAC